MNPKGRKAEEKVWETKFRHNFNTNYLQDPDLHTLLFIHGSEINGIIREALRDYMAKHKSKAADPEFQSTVFMTASIQVARGHRPTGAEVLADLDGHLLGIPPAAPSTPARRKDARDPIPAQVMHQAIHSKVNLESRDVAQAQSEVAVAAKPAVSTPSTTVEPVTPVVPKPRVVLDFGSEPEIGEDAEAGEASQRLSQRDKWLARHK